MVDPTTKAMVAQQHWRASCLWILGLLAQGEPNPILQASGIWAQNCKAQPRRDKLPADYKWLPNLLQRRQLRPPRHDVPPPHKPWLQISLQPWAAAFRRRRLQFQHDSALGRGAVLNRRVLLNGLKERYYDLSRFHVQRFDLPCHRLICGQCSKIDYLSGEEIEESSLHCAMVWK